MVQSVTSIKVGQRFEDSEGIKVLVTDFGADCHGDERTVICVVVDKPSTFLELSISLFRERFPNEPLSD